ncbi:MAG: cytochrome P450 [Rhizobiaceae bacterium]
MSKDQKLEPIPSPPKKAMVGNMLTVDKDNPLQSLMGLCREHGGIFELDMMGKPLIIASGADIIDELCDESRFDKAVRGSLRRVRAIGGDGLFTGDTVEPNWSKAHNILLPTFARQAMNNYMPMMLDISGQLMNKWERLNADDEIDVVHDMTSAALDIIGICGFNYRFNSFYRQDYHPFIDGLTRTLETCMMQRGLPFEQTLLRGRLAQMEKDVDYMTKLVDDIIRERRRGGDGGENDLLNYMLQGVDKVTGESLSDENIRFQINTFLIAGHETTSGLMSFVLYFLVNNADVLEKAYEEVDRVLGRDISAQPNIKQVTQLTYINQILLEALRLWPTAPAFGLSPYKDEVVGGKYKLKKGTFVTVLALMLHRDKSVWGEDAEKFNPDNFSKEAIAGRPINAYKPFGNGQRACIGRQFAMQEAALIIGMVLQRFQLFDHNKYELNLKETLSIKPEGFKIKVKLRPDVVRSRLVPGGIGNDDVKAPGLADTAKRPSHGTPALVLYGSNLGTTEDFARDLARSADANGFEATLGTLDEYAGKLPTSGAVLIACASYNGSPPDNAAKFVEWLGKAKEGDGKGVKYSVFGCGHSDWAATFQATPRIIEEGMKRIGATQICDCGEGDARDDIDDQFQNWVTGVWPAVVEKLDLKIDLADAADSEPLYQVEMMEKTEGNPLAEQSGAKPMQVVENYELQNTKGKNASDRSTRHIEVKMPSDVKYLPGDHLCVIPKNSAVLVARVAKRFGMDSNSLIRLTSTDSEHSQLPIDTPIALAELLSSYIELQAVATRKDVATLARYTECPKSRPKLNALAEDDYRDKVFAKKLSVLDILEQFPACELPLGAFLEIPPTMAPRYYSISSSPNNAKGMCSVTVGVVDAPAISGKGQFKGVCSNYLANQGKGDQLFASIRKSNDDYRLPKDPSTPVIMIGPGTGIAPFRGFLQERAALAKKGKKKVGETVLFFGCRHPEQDYIYKDELEAYAKAKQVDLHVAFSRKTKKKTYVQDLLKEQQSKVWKLLEQGAKIYVCGDGSRMEPDVRRMLERIYSEESGESTAAAEKWMDKMAKDERYVLDVWVSG